MHKILTLGVWRHYTVQGKLEHENNIVENFREIKKHRRLNDLDIPVYNIINLKGLA